MRVKFMARTSFGGKVECRFGEWRAKESGGAASSSAVVIAIARTQPDEASLGIARHIDGFAGERPRFGRRRDQDEPQAVGDLQVRRGGGARLDPAAEVRWDGLQECPPGLACERLAGCPPGELLALGGARGAVGNDLNASGGVAR